MIRTFQRSSLYPRCSSLGHISAKYLTSGAFLPSARTGPNPRPAVLPRNTQSYTITQSSLMLASGPNHQYDPSRLPQVTSKIPASNSLYISNINPLTDFCTTRDLFRRFSGYRKCRMTRGQNKVVAIIEFNSKASATIALSKLQNSPPLFVHGSELRIDFARPVKDQPLGARLKTAPQTGMEPCTESNIVQPEPPIASSSRASQSTALSSPPPRPTLHHPQKPSPQSPHQTSLALTSDTLRIRSREWWDMPPKAFKHLISQFEGFSSIRFRRNVVTIAFVQFTSNILARKAFQALASRDEPELQSLIIDFATPPVARKKSPHLFIRGKGNTSQEQLENELSQFPGFVEAQYLTPQGTRKGIRAFVTFSSSELASKTKDNITIFKPPISALIDDIGFAAPLHEPKQSQALYIGNIPWWASKRDVNRWLKRVLGVNEVILAATGDQGKHKGWAIVMFDSVERAAIAKDALPNISIRGSTPLTTRFYNNPNEREDIRQDQSEVDEKLHPVTTNMLSVSQIYDATSDDFREAFEKYDGFSHAVLFPDGAGRYMPYGKVTFHSAEQAQFALDIISRERLYVGNGENPVKVQGLRLRRALRDWKFRKPLREHWSGRVMYSVGSEGVEDV